MTLLCKYCWFRQALLGSNVFKRGQVAIHTLAGQRVACGLRMALRGSPAHSTSQTLRQYTPNNRMLSANSIEQERVRKGLAQPDVWSARLTRAGEASELAAVACARQARPLTTHIRT